MSDFSIYKSLKTSELTSNAQFSTTGTGSTTTVTGAANAISQSCRREGYFKMANISATTTEASVGEARVVQFTSTFISANLVASNGAAVANTTDYTLVKIYKVTAASNYATHVLVASANLANVAVSQWTPVPFALLANAANYQLAQGDVLTANCTVTGNGVANNLAVYVDVVIEDV